MIQQESKILFCFSPLLHVYSELYRSNGSQKTPFNTPAGKRWGSRPDIFDFADFLKFFDKRFRFRNLFGNSKKASCAESGWMAERSKALVSGTSLFGGVGSNPIPIRNLFLECRDLCVARARWGAKKVLAAAKCSRRGSNSRP